MIKCDHNWRPENIHSGHHNIVALVVCLKCNTIKKPLGAGGADMKFALEGSQADKERHQPNERATS